jgi:hypothetical protein
MYNVTVQDNASYFPTAAAIQVNVTANTMVMQQFVFALGGVMKWIYMLVGMFGVVSNMFVICVVMSSRPLRQQPRNWLIFHQSIADVICAIFIICNTFKDAEMQLNVSLITNQLV